jgi:hypothetical protein
MAPISLPREHGAYLTLGGALVAALVIAPDRLPAIGAGVIAAAGFFGRALVERGAVGAPRRRLDAGWAAALVVLALGGAGLVARVDARIAALAIGAVAAALAGAALIRKARLQRAVVVEQVGLGALGAVAGIAAWIGLAEPGAALGLGAVLAAHAAASVPIVRAAVRGQHPPPGLVIAIAAIAGGGAIAVIARPWAALALAPRVGQLLWLVRSPDGKTSPRTIGLRETALLAGVTAAACALGTRL